jgi:hypothetical protein
MPSFFASWPIRARSARREIDLEVARVQHDALRSVDRNGVRVRHRVSDRDELDKQRADIDLLTVLDRTHVDLRHEAGLFDAVPGQAKRECRTVDRERFAPQVAKPTF